MWLISQTFARANETYQLLSARTDLIISKPEIIYQTQICSNYQRNIFIAYVVPGNLYPTPGSAYLV